MNYPLLYTDNTFSWKRLWMLTKFYWSGVRRGVYICAVTAFVITLIAGFILKYYGEVPNYVLLPFSAILYMSPIMLTHRDFRAVSAQLPVTVMEKIAFLLLFFGVFVLSVIICSGTLGEFLLQWLFDINLSVVMESISIEQMKNLSYFAVPFVYFGYLTIILYFTLTAKSNRALACILSFFGLVLAEVIFCFIGGIFVGFIALNGCCEAGAGVDEQAITDAIARYTPYVIHAMVVTFFVAALICLKKLSKYLRNSGF